MEFPQQITSILVVRDSNGNIIVQIGPQPSVKIQSPVSSASIEMKLESPGSIPEIVFTDTTGTQSYRVQQTGSLLAIEKVPQTSGPAIYLDDNPGGGLSLYGEVGSARGIHIDDSVGFAYHVTPTHGAEFWTTLPLAAGYTPLGASVDYKLLPDGTIILRGTILANVNPIPAGTVIATLPAGYRIAQDALMGVVFDSSATQGRIVIRTTGNIECYDAPNARPSMDGVQFSII
jgi:hypothetical protein